MTRHSHAVGTAGHFSHSTRGLRRARFERQWRQKRRTFAIVGGALAFAAGLLAPTGTSSSAPTNAVKSAAKTSSQTSALIAARPVQQP